jgi:hypothetical protein
MFRAGWKLKFSMTRVVIAIVVTSNLVDFWFSGRSGNGFPIFSFMTSPVGRFDDYYNNLYVNNQLKNFYTVQHFVFWPIGVLFYQLLSFLPINLGLLLFQIASVLVFAIVLQKYSRNRLTTGALLLSFPVLFCLARGNNELILCAAILFALLKRSDYGTNRLSASIFILANLFEVSPFAFFLWHNPIRTFTRISRPFLVLVALFLLVFIGHSNIVEYFDGLSGGARYVSGAQDFSFINHHSLMSAIGVGNLYIFGEDLSSGSLAVLSRAILIIGTSVMILALKYKTFNKIDRLILVFVSWSIFPAVSADYKMVYLLFPFALLLGLDRHSNIQKTQIWLLAFSIVPKHYIWVHPPMNPVGGTLGGFLNPILLLLLFCLTITNGKNPDNTKSLVESRFN